MVGDTPVLVHNDGGYSNGDIDIVARHLSGEFSSPANDEMIARIRGAVYGGTLLTDGQQNFMSHELTEAKNMANGMSYEEAHEIALGTHRAGQNYDVDIIDKDESFGPWWRKQNGLPPRSC